MNGSRTEYFTSPAITNNISYLNKKLKRKIANAQLSKTTTDLKKMDTSGKNESDDLTNVYNNWTGNGDRVSGDVVPDMIEDDNVSHVGSDYSDFQPADQDNTFVQPNQSNFYGEQYNETDIKYNTSELMLRPPSGSAMHFNYNFPAVPSQSKSAYIRTNCHRTSTAGNNYAQSSYLNQSPSNSSGPSAAVSASSAATSSHYPTNSHSSSDCFHPNMWYPNAAFSSYSHGRQYGSQLTQDHMIDMIQLSNSGREARNRAEKNRRDKLNGSIQELSTMVPHVAESPRRVDKTAVLRFAAHGLRLSYVFGKSHSNEFAQTTDSLMKLLDSFFLTMTCNGQIVLVSSSIEQHLGHCQTDLYGQNLLHITHPEDHQMLKEKLVPKDLDKLFDIQTDNDKGEPRQRTQAEEDEIDQRLREDKRSFTIRLARSGPRSEPTVYELVRIDGSFRRSDMAPRGLKTSTFPSTLQLMRRSRGREEIMPLHTISGNDIVLIAIARLVRPPVINRSIEVNRLEYKTRHLIDGRIIDCDQRISLVAGYMTDEVRNLSPFTFMHQDDVRWVIVALRQMYDCNSSYGESTYRLFTGNGNIIYLHTKGFLEIDKNTNKVHSFICLNTLLDEKEGKRRVETMKNKFSVIINKTIPHSSGDIPASENPQQLEKAVLCLIQNLKSASDDGGDLESLPSTSSQTTKPQHATHNFQHYVVNSSQINCTSSLDLIPPATDSIKNSIIKSVNVVKTTAVKYLRPTTTNCTQQETAVDYNSETDFHTNNMPDHVEHIFHLPNTDSEGNLKKPEQDSNLHYTASGTVKRKIPYTVTKADSDEYIVPTQRQAIENVLSNSLQQINNRLNQQLSTAMEIRDQGQRYEVPHTEDRIADIMKEHQKQQEMYDDITNEFEFQRNKSSSSDNELLENCSKNALETIQHDQHQEYPQQQEQQLTLSTMPTTTNATSVPADEQLNTENPLQL